MRVLLMCPVCGHFVHPDENQINDKNMLHGCNWCHNNVEKIRIDYDAETYMNTSYEALVSVKKELREKYLFNNQLFKKEAYDDTYNEEMNFIRERKRYQENKNNPSCPHCGSTAISANKKGFGLGKAAVGGLVTGGAIGLLGGFIGSKKVEITCLNCGKHWTAGKR